MLLISLPKWCTVGSFFLNQPYHNSQFPTKTVEFFRYESAKITFVLLFGWFNHVKSPLSHSAIVCIVYSLHCWKIQAPVIATLEIATVVNPESLSTKIGYAFSNSFNPSHGSVKTVGHHNKQQNLQRITTT